MILQTSQLLYSRKTVQNLHLKKIMMNFSFIKLDSHRGKQSLLTLDLLTMTI